MEQKTLVTGATGNIGSEIVKQLKSKNANFIAGTTKREAINGVETIQADFSDKESLRTAMKGINTLFLLLPSHPEAINWGKNAIEIAKESGIKHIVRSSGMLANVNSDLLIEKMIGTTDEDVKNSGINFTITAPSSFMQNFSTQMVNDYKNGVIYQAADDVKISWVDLRDIAAVNVEILMNPEKYKNQTLKITGSESINYQEAISKMNLILGKETKYVAIPNEVASKAMADMHFPPFIIDLLISLNDSIKAGHFVETTDIIEEVTGKKPIVFNQFVSDYKKVWN